jgi:uncharacterized membrane protein YedE/YeeE
MMNVFKGTLLLASAFLLAIWLVKPIGVSTQFVIFNGIVMDQFVPDFVSESATNKSGYESTNSYLNKSGGKYAKSVANPLNYSYVFVIAMMLGAYLSSRFRKQDTWADRQVPTIWKERFGDSKSKRYVWSFIAGVLVLFGARLAGGCTSGHMMSGMMQTSLSGYIFALGTFATAVPLALIIFKKKGQ